MIEAYFDTARHTGFLRAVDLSTERLCGLCLSRDTCEEIDSQLRALRVEGYYAHILRNVANVTSCHVHSFEENPFCETHSPGLLLRDIVIERLVRGFHAAMERASGIEGLRAPHSPSSQCVPLHGGSSSAYVSARPITWNSDGWRTLSFNAA
jgi:hypothetical protein